MPGLNIIVCLDGGTLGPAARAALGLALTVGRGVQVVALAHGAEETSESLQVACASRVSRAVLLHDAILRSTSPLALAPALAEAIRRLQGSLVLFGAGHEDAGLGFLPAAVARALEAPYVARAETLHVHVQGASSEASIHVRSGGQHRHLRVPLPAVLTVPPSAPLAGRKRTRTNLSPPDVELWTLANLGIEPATIRRQDDMRGALETRRGKSVAVDGAIELLNVRPRPAS